MASREGELKLELTGEDLAWGPFTVAFAPSAGERLRLRALLDKAESAPPWVEPRRPDQDNSISRAVFAEGRLWMRSDAGVVFSIASGEARVREEKLPSPALDLCVLGGRVHVATRRPKSVTVLRRKSTGWEPAASFASPEKIMGLDCRRDTLTLLSASRVFVARAANPPRAIPLGASLVSANVMSVHVEGDEVHVGSNNGEWGGGLARVRLTDGKVEVVDRPSGGLCEGVINAGCDPVNGFASIPWKPGCVVAAVGVIHFTPNGKLIQICGDDVSLLYSRQVDPPGALGGGTVAFFGIARIGDALLAAGHDALYRITSHGVERTAFPNSDKGGIGLSLDVPGLALVLTSINQRRSMSGNVPMLVPMQ